MGDKKGSPRFRGRSYDERERELRTKIAAAMPATSAITIGNVKCSIPRLFSSESLNRSTRAKTGSAPATGKAVLSWHTTG